MIERRVRSGPPFSPAAESAEHSTLEPFGEVQRETVRASPVAADDEGISAKGADAEHDLGRELITAVRRACTNMQQRCPGSKRSRLEAYERAPLDRSAGQPLVIRDVSSDRGRSRAGISPQDHRSAYQEQLFRHAPREGTGRVATSNVAGNPASSPHVRTRVAGIRGAGGGILRRREERKLLPEPARQLREFRVLEDHPGKLCPRGQPRGGRRHESERESGDQKRADPRSLNPSVLSV
jgi:hypothetical protein